jgi:probable phosphoglycerate mutase
MILYCIRHGVTEFNAAGRIQGQLDSPLSAEGLLQAAAVAEALASQPIDAVFASPLRRAADTAIAIADRLGLSVQYDARLQEINAGIFQGLGWPEIGQRFPADAAQWRSHDPDYRIPGGESRRDLMHRAQAALNAIRATGHQQVLVVAHGGSLAAALKSLLEIPAHRNPFNLQNASITQLQWIGHDVKLLTLNQVDHLHDLASTGGDL